MQAFSPDNRYLAYQTGAGVYVLDLESEPLEPEQVVADPELGNEWLRIDFLDWNPVP